MRAREADFAGPCSAGPRPKPALSNSLFHARLPHGHDRPLPHHDPALQEILTLHAVAQLAQAPRSGGFSAGVRQDLIHSLRTGSVSLLDTARRLHVTERTLRRRLAAEQTSYADLLDEVRAALYGLLTRTASSSQELTLRLGFDSAGGFRRALARWIDRGLVAAPACAASSANG